MQTAGGQAMPNQGTGWISGLSGAGAGQYPQRLRNSFPGFFTFQHGDSRVSVLAKLIPKIKGVKHPAFP